MKSEEWQHIRENRLGSLCGTDKPTQAQIDIAENEADVWDVSQLDAETQAALRRIQAKARERRRNYAIGKRAGNVRNPHND